MVLMTVQFAQANGGQLPQHAPTSLPAGVLGLDGWADRLFVVSNCVWVMVAAWQAIKLHGTENSARSERDRLLRSVSPRWRTATHSSGANAAGVGTPADNEATACPQR